MGRHGLFALADGMRAAECSRRMRDHAGARCMLFSSQVKSNPLEGYVNATEVNSSQVDGVVRRPLRTYPVHPTPSVRLPTCDPSGALSRTPLTHP